MKEILDAARSLGVFVGVTDWYDTHRSPVKAMADAYYDKIGRASGRERV